MAQGQNWPKNAKYVMRTRHKEQTIRHEVHERKVMMGLITRPAEPTPQITGEPAVYGYFCQCECCATAVLFMSC